MRCTLTLGLVTALALLDSVRGYAHPHPPRQRMIRRQATSNPLPGPGEPGSVGRGAAVVSASVALPSPPTALVNAAVLATNDSPAQAGSATDSSGTAAASTSAAAGDAGAAAGGAAAGGAGAGGAAAGGAAAGGAGAGGAASGDASAAAGNNSTGGAESSGASGQNATGSAQSSSKADTKGGDPNLTVLQFALTLENLESQFYAQAKDVLGVKEFEKAGFTKAQSKVITQQITQQLIDEQAHVQILQQTIASLGAVPFSGCTFNFDLALSDAITFVSTARSIEAVGVGAYIGGAGLLTNKDILAAAATILPIEARHQTLLNLFSGGSAAPQSFDIGMTPPQVLALAGGFLRDCTPDDLGLTANQPLSVIDSATQSTFFTTGSVLTFQTSADISNVKNDSLSCQMLVGGAVSAIVMPASQCIIPPNVNGPVAIFLTSNALPLAGSVATQKTDNVIAGPALIFADTNQREIFQQAFQIKQLGVKSLPTANLGFAALQPQTQSAASNQTASAGAGDAAKSVSSQAQQAASQALGRRTTKQRRSTRQ